MLSLLVGVITAFNILIIIQKFKKGLIVNGVIDLVVMFLFVKWFGNSGQGGMVMAMTASAVVSIALFGYNFESTLEDDDEDEDEPEVQAFVPKGAI